MGALAVLLLVGTPRFESNDDVAMLFISNGYLYGEPAPHLVFMHVAVGHLLAALSSLTSSFAWYPALLYAVHVASLAAVLHAADVRRALRDPFRGTAVVAFVVAFHVAAWMNLQFTSTAFLAGIAGIALTVTDPGTRASRIRLVAAGLLLGAAHLLRSQALLGVLIASAPLLWQAGRRAPRRLAAVGGAVGAVVLLGLVTHHQTYGDQPAWQDYFAFNEARGALHATPALDALEGHPVLDEIGWSANDLDMFSHWFLTDADTFTTERLERLGSATDAPRNGLTEASAETVRFHGERIALALGIVALVAIAFAGVRWRFLVLHSAWVFAVMVGLAAFVRLPFRVSLPLWGLLVLPWLLPAGSRRRLRRRGVAAAAAAALVVVGAAGTLLDGYVESSRRNAFVDDRLATTLAALEETGAGTTHVVWGGAIPFQHLSPLRRDLPRPQLVPLGWQARSPLHEAYLDRLGIDDLALSLVERDDLRLLVRADDSAERIAALEQYVREHHGRTTSLEQVRLLPGMVVLEAR